MRKAVGRDEVVVFLLPDVKDLLDLSGLGRRQTQSPAVAPALSRTTWSPERLAPLTPCAWRESSFPLLRDVVSPCRTLPPSSGSSGHRCPSRHASGTGGALSTERTPSAANVSMDAIQAREPKQMDLYARRHDLDELLQDLRVFGVGVPHEPAEHRGTRSPWPRTSWRPPHSCWRPSPARPRSASREASPVDASFRTQRRFRW